MRMKDFQQEPNGRSCETFCGIAAILLWAAWTAYACTDTCATVGWKVPRKVILPHQNMCRKTAGRVYITQCKAEPVQKLEYTVCQLGAFYSTNHSN